METVEAGTALIVGTDTKTIYGEATRLLENSAAYRMMAVGSKPYGDGTASEKIIEILASKHGL